MSKSLSSGAKNNGPLCSPAAATTINKGGKVPSISTPTMKSMGNKVHSPSTPFGKK